MWPYERWERGRGGSSALRRCTKILNFDPSTLIEKRTGSVGKTAICLLYRNLQLSWHDLNSHSTPCTDSVNRIPSDSHYCPWLPEGHPRCKAITHDLSLSDDVSTRSLLPAASQRAILLHQAARLVPTGSCEVMFGGVKRSLAVQDLQVRCRSSLVAESGDANRFL